MDFNYRLPRRMLSSWVPHPRPRGAPMMTYGRSARKALEKFSIDSEMWPKLAADRAAWKETLRLGHPAIRQSLRIARRPATDYRRLAGADRRRVTALDGERIHPQPAPHPHSESTRERGAVSVQKNNGRQSRSSWQPGSGGCWNTSERYVLQRGGSCLSRSRVSWAVIGSWAVIDQLRSTRARSEHFHLPHCMTHSLQ